VQVTDQTVPELSKQQIIQIKSAAMEQRRWIRSRYTKIRELSSSVADSKAVFKHPGGFAGAAELALTQARHSNVPRGWGIGAWERRGKGSFSKSSHTPGKLRWS
jgi:hypothetical protein